MDSDRFLCTNREQCIPGSYLCDSVQQCWDGSDEHACGAGLKNQERFQTLNFQDIIFHFVIFFVNYDTICF